MKTFHYMLLLTMVMFFGQSGLADESMRSGKVVEALDAGSYTYAHLESQSGTQWIAIMRSPLSEGDTVHYSGGLEMTDFHSKSLDRNFESVLFVSHFEINSASTAKSAAHSHTVHGDKSERHSETLDTGPVTPMEGGFSVGELYTRSVELEAQEVSLRARVTKFNGAIMGKNWVTLHDGTGVAPDTLLIATTLDNVQPGDIVVVTGVVRNDVDLGYGYHYKLLLEEAEFSQHSGD